jgi:ankyrin repeat protein
MTCLKLYMRHHLSSSYHCPEQDGRTPLHIAAMHGQKEVLAFLMDHDVMDSTSVATAVAADVMDMKDNVSDEKQTNSLFCSILSY